MKNIYWININRFDEKTDKSTWLEISEILINSNFSVTLLTGYSQKKWVSKAFRLNIKYFKSLNNPYFFKLSLNLLILFWLLRNTNKNDIIIVSADSLWLSVILKGCRKCKIHLDIRTVPVEIHNIKNRLDYLIFFTIPMKIFHRRADSYSFITKLLKQNIENTFHVQFKDYAIWTSGVNIEHFATVRESPKKSSNKYVLTYLGVVTRNRGIDRVLKAIGRLNEMYKQKVLFQVIGDGPFLPYLKQISSDLGLNDRVLFKGHIPYDTIPKNLMDTDCFICPLPDRSEWNVSSPLKVFEYLACAKPVILTPIVSHKNIIENEDFIIWTEGDKVDDFIKAIEYALKNTEKLKRKSRMAIETVRNNYEWAVQGNIFVNYLRKKYNSSYESYSYK